jgi:hypothetical protein
VVSRAPLYAVTDRDALLPALRDLYSEDPAAFYKLSDAQLATELRDRCYISYKPAPSAVGSARRDILGVETGADETVTDEELDELHRAIGVFVKLPLLGSAEDHKRASV